ncbi:polysaccharide biosynthesis/export family protein [Citrobacter freundii]
MKIIELCAVLLFSILLVGCTTSSPRLMDDPATVQQDYRLGAGDTVNIAVHGQPDMTMRFILDKSGEINFPFVGALKLQDKTVDQVTKELTQRLTGDYFTTPMVTVSIAEFRKYYVSGEVKSPNGFVYEPGLTVEKSIAQAGGFTDRADRQDINIRLSGSNQLLENVDLTHSVHPGDVVIIGMGFF